MFDAHPPFQIDGNFGGTAGIVEMLVQQDGDTIELLPALPPSWPRGKVTGLRLRGGITLDLEWRDGAVELARLRSRARASRRLVTPRGLADVALSPDRPTVLKAGAFR